ncbi:MAG TPA: choice-of-anchor U domain-containing protein [Candidatus Saccharimonadaceae bacterium]|nr:choice-of-anchor U domain-containing protein [Candidatus Saccharimonadaceae bacterium]
MTLNPGGGVLTNGSDGIRFTVNSDPASGNPNNAFAGADAVVYRNTYQYCCAAGGPMLNIGGTLYGQAGPASSSQAWSSVELVSISGAAVEGDRTSATGNSGAVLRYTATVGELEYVMTRTLSYVYPNDYVTDSYSFVIPEGNEVTVKFYLGGDTAPGSSDSGYGVMLTSPVRSVISLNTSSNIMFGFREVSGSRAFDGATSQHYSAPYNTVRSGGDIGYVVTTTNHDAGLMMQWNLGSTPGTQTAVLQQFATRQGTNLNAAFLSSTTEIGEPVLLSISIVNTELVAVNGLDYTVALPSGLVIDTGSQTNSCGGTMTATAGGSSITLTDGTVEGASNCVVSIPVVAADAGTYAVSGASFSGLSETLTNNVGNSSLTVSNPELGTDLNDDGISDAEQTNLYSYTSGVTAKTVLLEVAEACSITKALSVDESATSTSDEGYQYVNGLMDFSLACGTPGFTTTIKQYYYGVPSSGLLLRKYDPNTGIYTTIEDAVIEQITINGNIVTVVSYEVTDGGALDTDGLVNGNIEDPAGLASTASAGEDEESETPGVPNTGIQARDGVAYIVILAVGALIIIAAAVGLYKQDDHQI